MGMLRLVRAYTGKEKIIKFEGCYHGTAKKKQKKNLKLADLLLATRTGTEACSNFFSSFF